MDREQIRDIMEHFTFQSWVTIPHGLPGMERMYPVLADSDPDDRFERESIVLDWLEEQGFEFRSVRSPPYCSDVRCYCHGLGVTVAFLPF